MKPFQNLVKPPSFSQLGLRIRFEKGMQVLRFQKDKSGYDMKTFKFKSTMSGPAFADGSVEAESSELAIKAIQEGAGLDPGTYILTSRDEQITFSIPDPPLDPAETTKHTLETREFHSFGRKVKWISNGIFPTGVIFPIGLAFYLGTIESLERYEPVLFPLVAFGGCLFCGIARLVIQTKMLESFVCPSCHTPNDNWQKDSKYYFYYKCRKCGIKWDIGYKEGPSRRIG